MTATEDTRETARQGDGKFGPWPRSELPLGLPDLDPEIVPPFPDSGWVSNGIVEDDLDSLTTSDPPYRGLNAFPEWQDGGGTSYHACETPDGEWRRAYTAAVYSFVQDGETRYDVHGVTVEEVWPAGGYPDDEPIELDNSYDEGPPMSFDTLAEAQSYAATSLALDQRWFGETFCGATSEGS